MKVVHFVAHGAVTGGVERYLAELLGDRRGSLEHAIVMHDGGRCSFGGPWPVMTMRWMAEDPAPPDAGAAREIGALAGVCLFHYPPSRGTVAAARRAGRAVAVFCHDHRWWCASGSRFHALAGRACGIRASTAACALRYFPLRCGGLRPGRMVRGLAHAAAARDVLAAADAVLTASAFMAAEAQLHGAPHPRTHVIPLPSALASAPPAPPAGGAPPVLLFASRLTPEKGVTTLLEAFAVMRETAVLELAGTGIAAAAAARRVARHPRAARIRLLGHLESTAMRDAYARASAVVVPSLWPEPFGLVGVEALAAGRPVVATTVGGTAEWARGDLGVIAVPPGDGAALGAALDRVLAEPAWTQRAREAGARWVREHHSLEAHVARLGQILAPLATREDAA